MTESMRYAIDETARRRAMQDAFNKAHGIVPKTIKKSVREVIQSLKTEEKDKKGKERLSLKTLEKQMHEAAAQLRFEDAARLRDKINRIKGELDNESNN